MNFLLDIILLKGGFIHDFITWIIENGGLYFLLFVIFAETGLFVGFFCLEIPCFLRRASIWIAWQMNFSACTTVLFYCW